MNEMKKIELDIIGSTELIEYIKDIFNIDNADTIDKIDKKSIKSVVKKNLDKLNSIDKDLTGDINYWKDKIKEWRKEIKEAKQNIKFIKKKKMVV